MKRILSLTLAAALLIGLLIVPAAAAENETRAGKSVSEIVEILALADFFRGTGNGFELEVQPTRVQAAVAFVRMLGLEDKALATPAQIPFTDVPVWAEPYVSCLYDAGLTKGISADKFGSNDLVTADQFYTFVLRAVGYAEGTQFNYNTAHADAVKLGVTDGKLAQSGGYTRLDMAVAMYEGLNAKVSGTGEALINWLEEQGSVKKYAAELITGTNELYNLNKEIEAAVSYEDLKNMTLLTEMYMTMGDGGLGTMEIYIAQNVKIDIAEDGTEEIYSEQTMSMLGLSETTCTYQKDGVSYTKDSYGWAKDEEGSALLDIDELLGTYTTSYTSIENADAETMALAKELYQKAVIERKEGKVIITVNLNSDSVIEMIPNMGDLGLEGLDISEISIVLLYDENTYMLESMIMSFDSVMDIEGAAYVVGADMLIKLSDAGTTVITLDDDLLELLK